MTSRLQQLASGTAMSSDKDNAAPITQNGNGNKGNTDEANKPALVSIQAATKQRDMAVSFASKATQDVILTLDTIADSAEDVKKGAVILLTKLRDAYKDDLHSFPRPGTKTGNNPDFVRTKIRGENGMKEVEQSFYSVFAAALPNGAAVEREIEELKKGDQGEFAYMSPANRKAHMAKLTGRRNTFRQQVKRALEIEFQFFDIANKLPNVVADFIYSYDKSGRKGDIVDSPKQIRLHTKGNETNPFPLGSGQFVALDVDAAAENEGTAEALVATAGRSKKDTSEQAAARYRVEKIEDFEAAVGSIANWVERNQKNLKDVLKRAASDEAFADSIGDACFALDELWTTLKPSYMARQKARAAQQRMSKPEADTDMAAA